MASSAENPPRHLSTPFAATAAPPPTPSTQLNLPTQSSSSDFISHLLHRLPPSLSLSLPSRRPSPLSSSAAAVAVPAANPPMLSLSSLRSSLLPASTELGFFHLADHPIQAGLPSAAEATARSLFALTDDLKQSLFPANWPLGHDTGDDEDGAAAESFCLDNSSCSAALSCELDLGPLREFSAEMEKLGLTVVDALAGASGFESPAREKLCSLMWISDGSANMGRVYPYAVGLHYQIQRQNQSLLSDSGWVSISGRADSLLVTIGDIAQVWSNGKLKKVRGRPISSIGHEEGNNDSRHVTMSLLITLGIESTVCPLIPGLVEKEEEEEEHQEKEEEVDDPSNEENERKRLFTSFSFEDYAWRVYHERLALKDPLVRYRL